MPRHEVVLKLQGVTYAGWETVRINRGLEQLAGTFELGLTDKWSLDASMLRIRDGQACQVLIDGTPVITGWVDDVEPGHGADEHTLRVRGRDKAGDLVDCAAIHATQEWAGRTLAQVAGDLVRPFGIGVQVATAIGSPFQYTHIDDGETVWEVLERAARLRGVLIVSDSATGDIVITRAAARRAIRSLRLGHNILGGSSVRSQRDRYSLYRVTGQQRETDFIEPEQAATSKAEVRDRAISRYRPTVIAAEGAADISDCRTRARWERSVRSARGQRATVRVRGWLDGDAPWAPNTLVAAEDPWLGLDGDYLIAGVEYAIDESEGQISSLSLVPPAAYEVLPEKETDPAGESNLFSLGAAP